MARYCLSINILSDKPDLLDKLMLTLESLDGDMSALQGVEIQTSRDKPAPGADEPVTELERGVALEHWFLPEGL